MRKKRNSHLTVGVALLAVGAVYVLLWGCATTGGAPEPSAQGHEVRRAQRTDIEPLKKRAAAVGLVSLADVAPSILIDLRYGRPGNTSGKLYPENMPCLVNRSTAEKLRHAQHLLRDPRAGAPHLGTPIGRPRHTGGSGGATAEAAMCLTPAGAGRSIAPAARST